MKTADPCFVVSAAWSDGEVVYLNRRPTPGAKAIKRDAFTSDRNLAIRFRWEAAISAATRLDKIGPFSEVLFEDLRNGNIFTHFGQKVDVPSFIVRASNAVDTYFADRTAGGFVTYRNGLNLAAKFARQEAEAVAVEFLKGFTVSMNVAVAQVLDGNRQVVAEYEWIGNGPRRRAKVGVPILLVQVVRVGDARPSYVSYFSESKPEAVSLNSDLDLARLFFSVEEAWPAFMAAKTWTKASRISITTAREGLQ